MTPRQAISALITTAATRAEDSADAMRFSQAALNAANAALCLADLEAREPPVKPNIEEMAIRFLSWRLPEDFNPDGGISFTKVGNENTPYAYRNHPSGTNLFSIDQARDMLKYLVYGDGGTEV